MDFSQNVGEIVEVENSEGARMIAAGQAESVSGKKENASSKKQKEKR